MSIEHIYILLMTANKKKSMLKMLENFKRFESCKNKWTLKFCENC